MAGERTNGETNNTKALATALADVDQHLAAAGWDQPTRLYALVKTADLLRAEPELAERLDLADGSSLDTFTSVEQEAPPADAALDEWLAGIAWPDAVDGCALAQEVVTLPPGAEADLPEGTDVARWATGHPQRREMRMLVGVLRDGSRASILRMRSMTSEPDDVVTGEALVPNLADALAATLTD